MIRRVRDRTGLLFPALGLILIFLVILFVAQYCGVGPLPPVAEKTVPGETTYLTKTVPGPERTTYVTVPVEMTSVTAADIPEFPWPPPQWSTNILIPSESLRKPAGGTTYLSDIEQKLRDVLDSQGYSEIAYYSVPDGFALVTRIEHFFPDGTIPDEADRWGLETTQLRKFSLSDYLNALFTADPGYYRVIVFVVTDRELEQAPHMVNHTEAEDWVRGGSTKLPKSIGSREYSDDYNTTALIYEFEKPTRGDQAIFRGTNYLLTAKDHLVKAKIWSALGD